MSLEDNFEEDIKDWKGPLPFTRTYLAMVSKATDDLNPLWVPGVGDWVCVDGLIDLNVLIAKDLDGLLEDEKEFYEDNSFWFYKWVPRLDQLLGMVPSSTHRELDGRPDTFFYIAGRGFFDGEMVDGMPWGDGAWCADVNEEMFPFTEWHELALAVVMKEKFGKTWRDGKWME